MEEFIQHYGLLAVYVGMLIEGETVLTIGGYLMHAGLFRFWWLLFASLSGALTIDLAAYAAGRYSGRSALLGRFHARLIDPQSWKARLAEHWLVVLAARFLYGTRTAFIFYLGSRQMSWGRFLPRELFAAGVWCAAYIVFGHAIGHALSLIYGEMHRHHRVTVVIVMAVVGTVIAVLIRIHLRTSRRSDSL